YPGFLGQRILQRLRVVRAGQRPEERDRDARRPIPRRLNVDQMDREGVARLGALHIEGPRLWIDIGVLADLAEQIPLRADLPGETVLRIEVEDVARLDASDRIDAAERPGVLLFSWNDPFDVDRLDHWPAFSAARRSASTWRALASAARRRSSDAGSVIRRRWRRPPLGRDRAPRPPGSSSRLRLPRGDDDTI